MESNVIPYSWSAENILRWEKFQGFSPDSELLWCISQDIANVCLLLQFKGVFMLKSAIAEKGVDDAGK